MSVSINRLTDMNLHIYIKDSLAKELDLLIEETGQKRNTLIQAGILLLVESYKKKNWPPSILQYKGVENAELVTFESYRRELLEPISESLLT